MHLHYNELMRAVGTQLLGRRMYETMAVWETDSALAEESATQADFATAWQDSDKIVFSTTLRDEVQLVLSPIAVGSGKPAFPSDLRLDLALVGERCFGNGAVHVAYRVQH